MNEIDKLLRDKVGDKVDLKPDYILINDTSGEDVVANLKDPKVSEDVSDRLIVGFDHDVPTGTLESSVRYQKLSNFTDANGLDLIHAEGIMYLAVLNQIDHNSLLVSTGNHNGIFGIKDSIGLKITDSELADLLQGKDISRKVPEPFYVTFSGVRTESLSPVDIAINVWNQLQDQDIKGKLIKFIDPENKLEAQDKLIISSMSTLFGAMSSIFVNDKGNDYDIDLNKMERSVILPEKADHPTEHIEVKAFTQVKDIKFKVGFIGGFTGGTINDLRIAAKLVKGKHIKFGKRLNICPATSDDYVKALDEGLIDNFLDFGAQIISAGDKSVIKQGAGIVGDEIVISTGSYNYAGCLSDKRAKIYLGSVKSVIESLI